MIMNLLVIAFILVMGYWWGRQGLFSAFLHLLATIAAGAIALALWEPLTLGWLLDRMPAYAWGVGLLAPFILSLILFRVALDKFAPGNVYFNPVTNRVAGGILGVLSAILSAGLAIIGIGFLDLPSSMAGYEPLVINTDGTLVEQPGAGLWIGVDRQAAAFFAMISGGSFSSGSPLNLYQPDLATQAALFRLKYDPNSSVTASPKTVSISSIGAFPTPLKGVDDAVVKAIGTDAQVANHKIVVIDTAWVTGAGTFDSDSTLRVFPTQVRLLSVVPGATPAQDSDPQLEPPVGVVMFDNGQRSYTSLRDSHSFASVDQRATLAWIFTITSDRVPRSIFIRHLRLDLPPLTDASSDPTAAAAMLGRVPIAATETASTAPPGGGVLTPNVGTQSGVNPGGAASALEVSSELPASISMNLGHALTYEGNLIKSGHDNVAPASGFVPPGVKASALLSYPTHTIVRMKVEAQKAQSLLGASRVDAASLGAVTIEDAAANQYFPMGYAWLKSDGSLDININRDQEIRSARELPVSQMSPAETLYVYFTVPHKVQITRIHFGQAVQDANLQVP